jgi:hypothetical protein
VGRGEARAYPALLDPRAGAARDERHDRRLRLTVRCALATPGPCNATVRLTWRRRGRTVQLASLERALVQGRRNFALELPRGFARGVCRAGRNGLAVTACVRLRDPAGDHVVRTARIRLRPRR